MANYLVEKLQTFISTVKRMRRRAQFQHKATEYLELNRKEQLWQQQAAIGGVFEKGIPKNTYGSWKLVIGNEPLDQLLRKSQASIHRLDELDPKMPEEAREQAETVEYLQRELGNN